MWLRLAAIAQLLLLIGLACADPAADGPGRTGPAAGDDPTAAPGAPLDDRIRAVSASWKTDWSKRSIDLGELIVGITGRRDSRDVIPPLDSPKFETVSEASAWLSDREPVVLLDLPGEARAYPIQVLTWHEIVNDRISDLPVAITYCPLCNSAVGFDRRVSGQVLRFGVSGLLRKSDLVMWDDRTESLWQQITGEAIVGELTGTQLELIPTPMIRWSEFKSSFPEGKVLSRQTGFERAYGLNPYEYYDSQPQPFLFDGEIDQRYPAMERVVGVVVEGADKAYPFSVIEQERAVNDEVAGVPIVVFWGAGDTASALDAPDISRGREVGVGLAYLRTVSGGTLTFAPFGDGRFRDRQTGSTWDLLGRAVAGPLAGEALKPVVQTNHLWFAWAAFNADAPVYSGEG